MLRVTKDKPVTADGSESELSDTSSDSLDSEKAFYQAEVSRLYRPPSAAASSAYDIALPPKRTRKTANPDDASPAPPSRVIDYAAYTKAEARAELAQATQKEPPPLTNKAATVPEHLKAAWNAAYAKPNVNAKTPVLDFTLPGASSSVSSAYDFTAWGGSAAHHSARMSVARYDGNEIPAGMTASLVQHKAPHGPETLRQVPSTAEEATGDDASGQSNSSAVQRSKDAGSAEVRRIREELVTAIREDPERADFLRLMLSLHADLATEYDGAAKATQPVEPQPMSPVNVTHRDPEHQLEHDQRVQQVAAAVENMRAGRPFDAKTLEDVPVFDYRAAAVLASHTRTREVEAEATRVASQRFYTALTALEEIVSSPSLTQLVRRLLEQYRRQFMLSKPARERGEYTHEDHAAFRHFASVLEEFIFSRVSRVAGPDFDAAEFLEWLLDDAADDDTGDSRHGQRLLSSDTWELLLALLSFESFVDLMDQYIFSHNTNTAARAA